MYGDVFRRHQPDCKGESDDDGNDEGEFRGNSFPGVGTARRVFNADVALEIGRSFFAVDILDHRDGDGIEVVVGDNVHDDRVGELMRWELKMENRKEDYDCDDTSKLKGCQKFKLLMMVRAQPPARLISQQFPAT